MCCTTRKEGDDKETARKSLAIWSGATIQPAHTHTFRDLCERRPQAGQVVCVGAGVAADEVADLLAHGACVVVGILVFCIEKYQPENVRKCANRVGGRAGGRGGGG